jgi:NADH:quinone reductase (non-electrogenic)
MSDAKPRRIVIVGGGFAGAELGRELHRRLPRGWEVQLFSRENHFVFTPLLAEVVGSAINPLHVVWPVREMVRGLDCRTAEVLRLDLPAREVVYRGARGEEERQGFDHLVIACGLAVKLDMIPGMAEHGWPLKTLGDALALRNHIVHQLERAEVEVDPEDRADLLSFAVVGGGFTGVEVAGSLMDLLKESTRFYERFGEGDVHVTVVDGGKRILGPLPENLAAYADRRLRAEGVEIRSGVRVKAVSADGIDLGGGDFVRAATVIAAVGTTVQPLLASCELPMEHGRIQVTGEMRVQGFEDVWALGDCAAVPNALDGEVSPTLAQFAMRQAKQLARNLRAVVEGGTPRPFHYHTKGMFAAIGHRTAVGNPFGVRVAGLPAYFLWRSIYWAKMPSLARRLQIAFDWFWDLFFPRDLVEIDTARSDPRGGSPS